MDEQETRPLPEVPPVLSYQRPRTTSSEIRRPWHVFVTLALCWVPAALVPVRFLVDVWDVSQGKPGSLSGAAEAAIIGFAMAGILAVLAYRAVMRALRSETMVLRRLALAFGVVALVCALGAIDALHGPQVVTWRDALPVIATVALGFVTWSMGRWGRQLDRVLSR